MFTTGATEGTIQAAYTLVNEMWREFSSAFVSSNMVQSSDFNFEQEYQTAIDSLRTYGTFDSVRGLITFCQNRVVWAGIEKEQRITDDLTSYGNGELEYFSNQYQVAAGEAGAARKGFLSNEVDDDFRRLALGYHDAMQTLLLVGVETADIAAAMDMARIVWMASREQFRYMLAMNDIIYKAEL